MKRKLQSSTLSSFPEFVKPVSGPLVGFELASLVYGQSGHDTLSGLINPHRGFLGYLTAL